MVNPWIHEESKKFIIYPETEISGWALKKTNIKDVYDFRMPPLYLRNLKLNKSEVQKIKNFNNFIAKIIRR